MSSVCTKLLLKFLGLCLEGSQERDCRTVAAFHRNISAHCLGTFFPLNFPIRTPGRDGPGTHRCPARALPAGFGAEAAPGPLVGNDKRFPLTQLVIPVNTAGFSPLIQLGLLPFPPCTSGPGLPPRCRWRGSLLSAAEPWPLLSVSFPLATKTTNTV